MSRMTSAASRSNMMSCTHRWSVRCTSAPAARGRGRSRGSMPCPRSPTSGGRVPLISRASGCPRAPELAWRRPIGGPVAQVPVEAVRSAPGRRGGRIRNVVVDGTELLVAVPAWWTLSPAALGLCMPGSLLPPAAWSRLTRAAGTKRFSFPGGPAQRRRASSMVRCWGSARKARAAHVSHRDLNVREWQVLQGPARPSPSSAGWMWPTHRRCAGQPLVAGPLRRWSPLCHWVA